jgi:predicted GNAT family N-acyltransferase
MGHDLMREVTGIASHYGESKNIGAQLYLKFYESHGFVN